MAENELTAQNAYLTKMLKQAGLDAEAQVVAARIQSVLTDEIHHRMKNMLTMVTAIVRQSMRSATSLAAAEEAIATRLIAMAKAHDLLLKADLKSAALSDVVRGALDQHNSAADRITASGNEIQITPASILPITLMLNELCTNATKYGALSKEGGHVSVAWEERSEQGELVLKWIEFGGPPVAAPGARSFGTRLLEEALPRQLGGCGALIFSLAGLEYVLTVPLASLIPMAPPQ
jgi:two-component sensor histidine kinase